jgi:uncharacterized protein with HEPN domain
MNLYFEKINRIFEECQRHIYRMDLAHTEIAHLMPLSVETYEKLTDADIKTIDQFLFRFSKLQDAIGKKLFKTTLLALGEDIEGEAFIDILNRLEKIDLIADIEGWFELRRMRNELAHEYEEDKKANAEAITIIHQSADRLKTYFSTIHVRMKKRFENKS